MHGQRGNARLVLRPYRPQVHAAVSRLILPPGVTATLLSRRSNVMFCVQSAAHGVCACSTPPIVVMLSLSKQNVFFGCCFLVFFPSFFVSALALSPLRVCRMLRILFGVRNLAVLFVCAVLSEEQSYSSEQCLAGRLRVC